jgi:hypothetical protein
MAYTNIDDPSAYFQATTYTGTNSSGNSITNSGNSDLQPDMVWIKVRTYDNPHIIQDTSRGFAGNGEVNLLQSASTAAETTNGAFESFDSNGFTVGGTNATSRAYNGSTDNYIAWQWKANGGSTSSNTDGTITSTVQANTDAGFSIVTWTGNESASATVGHGLGVAPDMWIAKRRNGTYNWQVYTSALAPIGSNNLILTLNSTAAAEQVSGTSFTSSSTFQPSSNAKRNSGNMIAYCFASKQGYSKVGSYIGNGFANGPFVYTGFKPAFVLVKNTSAVESWVVYDTTRNTFNLTNLKLSPDTDDRENNNSAVGGAGYNDIDILSNGFKCRSNNAATNGSGNTIIYMAFAENPFVTSTGTPTTAR